MQLFKRPKARDTDSSPEVPPTTSLKKKNLKKHWGIRVFLVIFAMAILLAGAFGLKTIATLSKVIKSHNGAGAVGLKGDLDLNQLKGEGEGRVNILLLGTGDTGHAGEDLTDTILLASIDPKTNDVALISVPRDLYVKIPGFWWSKINAAYVFAEQQKEDSGAEVIKQTVSQVLGVPVHYFLKVDFTGLKKSVDAIGGVDVYNPSNLSDPDYPCDRNGAYTCGFNLKAGYHHMDGALALKFTRCRKGSCGDDYGRALRQQVVLVAMRDKALQLDNILNPAKVNDLLTIVGNHLSTDISLEEMKRLIAIGRRVDANAIVNTVLENEFQGLVKNSNVGDVSVVIPTDGVGNYRSIQSYIKSLLIDGYIKSESAKVEIIAGGDKLGYAYALSIVLQSLGYNVIKTPAIIASGESKTQLIDYTNGDKPYTAKYLSNRLGVEVSKQNRPAGSQAEIVIILGADYEFKNSD